ncbi:MAG: acyltransferase [Acidimicrobiia bacterium]
MSVRRWPALDGLRGFAILFVLAAHSNIVHVYVAGQVGVTLFFVLSGFLITYLLLDEVDETGGVDLKAFYGRRALRLLPALLVYLVGVAILVSVLGLGLPVWDMTWPPALYVANYVQIFGQDLYAHRHLWSLAVEEHFYLVWPVLVWLGATRRLKILGLVLVGLVAWRLGIGVIDAVWAYHSTDTNAYALGIGCLLAAAYQRGWRIRLHRRTAEAGVFVLLFLCLVPVRDLGHLYEVGVWLSPLAALVSALCIYAAVELRPAFLEARGLRWFGGISYALYLWHAPLLQIPTLAASPLTRLTALGLAIGIAWLSWTWIESPILKSRWRQRFLPGSRRADTVNSNIQA